MCDSTGCATAQIDLTSTASSSTSTTTCQYYCGQAPPPSTGPPTTPPPSPNVTLQVQPTAYPGPGQAVDLVANASNPTSATYDLRVTRLDDGFLVRDCGQTLHCDAWDEFKTSATMHYIAELRYADGSPSQYSNEVTVIWGGISASLTACLTPSACPDISAHPPAGAPAYLTATANNASTPDYLHQVYWRLVIVDDATRQTVRECPIGETPCQVSVTGPPGATKGYFAYFAWVNQVEPGYYSNRVDVTWGPAPTTTTSSPPTTTSIPPTTTTTTRPTTTTTASAPPTTTGRAVNPT
jgi:hypothetical protein